jgi:hypothetical protein
LSSEAELTGVVFGQHVHPILISVIFSSAVVRRVKFTTSTPKTKELTENIRREIANIPAEQLQSVNQNLFRRREECLHVEGQHL